MRLLLDTHALLWAALDTQGRGGHATPRLRELVISPDNALYFSAAAIWEIAVKSALNRPGFSYDARRLRSRLLEGAFQEAAISGTHGIVAGSLPPIHKDPFDRIMIAQAQVEGMVLVTHDKQMLRYSGQFIAV